MFTPRARIRFYGSPANYLTAARHVLGRNGRDYRTELEAEVAAMTGARHAICVPQARFGLYLAFARLLTRERPEIVMSPYTIHDVVNMVLCAGGKPVFVDIEPATCNIDPAKIEAAIGPKTGAVMVTHLHGLACDMDRVMAICNRRGVPVIEDAAQSFGAKVGGKWLGSIGKVGVYSFGRVKNVNTFFGGMVVTSDDALADAIRAELAALPEEDPKKLAKRIATCAVGDLVTVPPLFSPVTFRIFRLGAVRGVKAVNKIVQTESDPVRKDEVPAHYRRRMTQMQARIALDQIPHVEEKTAARLAAARIYHEGLRGEAGIQLPPWREDGSHIYLQYAVQLPDRWSYVRYMMQHGRDLAIQHMGSAAELEIFADFRRDCPEARAVADRVVLLPTYPGYPEAEVRANVEVTRAYLRRV